MNKEKFSTAICCIDGRALVPVIDWMRNELGVDYVDCVTEPGADGVLSANNKEAELIIKKKAMVSIKDHRSLGLAIVGHHDCVGNPVSEKRHKEQILAGVKIAASWGLNVPIFGLWVDESWKVEEICQSE